MKYTILFTTIFILFSCQNQNTEKTNQLKTPQPSTHTTQKSALQVISPEIIKQKMDVGKNITLIDVRTPEEFANGHIKWAYNVSLQDIANGKLEALPDKNTALYLYCRSGNRSNQAGKILVEKWYSKVYDFGGIIDWKYWLVR